MLKKTINTKTCCMKLAVEGVVITQYSGSNQVAELKVGLVEFSALVNAFMPFFCDVLESKAQAVGGSREQD